MSRACDDCGTTSPHPSRPYFVQSAGGYGLAGATRCGSCQGQHDTQRALATSPDAHSVHDDSDISAVSPGKLAQQMLAQRSQNEEMDAWQHIFNDRRKK